MDFEARAGGRTAFSRLRPAQKVSVRTVGFFLFAFLLSKASLFGEIMPFGAALYATFYYTAPPIAIGALSVSALLFPEFMPVLAIKYALAILLFSFIAAKHGNIILASPLSRGAVMGGCVFAAGLFMLLGGQLLMYDCFLLVLEAGIITASVCLFQHTRMIFSGKKTLSSPLDMLSVSAVSGIIILGVSGFLFLLPLSLTIPLSVLAILLLTHESGLESGAIAGTTLGLLAMLESGDPVLGAFATSGMAAGYFSKYGRAGASLAFVCAAAAVTFYTGGTTEMVLHISETLAPALIYLAIPPGLLGKLSSASPLEKDRHSRASSFLVHELREKAEAFSKLSCAFTDITDKKLFATGSSAASFFEKAVRYACEGCKKSDFCWKQEFHRTYASFFVMLELACKKGEITRDDIPISLAEKCIRPPLLPEAFNHMYEVYRTSLLWEARTEEARGLVARQLSSVAHILESMEKAVRRDLFENEKMEEILRASFAERGIAVQNLSVLEGRRGALSVQLCTDPKTPGNLISEIVSKGLRLPLEITSEQDGHFCLSPHGRLRLAVSGETKAREGSPKSGDNFESLYLENGYYFLAISDGMGSGLRASEDSRAALSMLRTLFRAGFDAETAVGLVNSVLVLRSAEDAFATLDLLLVNTHSLEAEFMKAGAAASFIRHGKDVRTYAAGSLPAGMLTKPDLAHLRAKLAPGDMIVMLSDGAAEPGASPKGTAWVSEAIASYDGDDPHALMQIILQLAKEKSGGHVRDDMTVLCAAAHRAEDFIA